MSLSEWTSELREGVYYDHFAPVAYRASAAPGSDLICRLQKKIVYNRQNFL